MRTLLALLEHLGIPLQGDALEFPLTVEDEYAFSASLAPRTLPAGTYACVHPGARLRSRRWWPERFAAVADTLAAEGLQIVLTGSVAELPLTQEVAAAMRAPALNLAGRTNLGALGCILRGARVLVCNDTGVSHVAAGLGVPSVVIACGSDTERWAPSNHERHRVIAAPTECRPCGYETCPIDHRCAAHITPELVIAEIHHLLSGSEASPLRATSAPPVVNIEQAVTPPRSPLERNRP